MSTPLSKNLHKKCPESQDTQDGRFQFYRQPDHLAFVFALFFSIPCIGTLGTLYAENNSLKWMVIAACYYYTLTSFVMEEGGHIRRD